MKEGYKAHSESLWKCYQHEEEIVTEAKVTYADLSVFGIPICSECGEDMEFIEEDWVDTIQ